MTSVFIDDKEASIDYSFSRSNIGQTQIWTKLAICVARFNSPSLFKSLVHFFVAAFVQQIWAALQIDHILVIAAICVIVTIHSWQWLRLLIRSRLRF